MSSLVVIPCRYHSSRLPKKHTIVLSNGKTMPQMVYERCCQSHADRVIVATDHEEIYQSLVACGCEVMMTDANHASGTDRVAEVATHFPEYQLVINVQGDEPLIDITTINALLDAKANDLRVPVYSVMTAFNNEAALRNRNNVKVVVDKNRHALYFSRAAIGAPAHTQQTKTGQWHCYKHLGLYAFNRGYLLSFPHLPHTPLSLIESLEQLRVLESGETIGMIEVDEEAIGVDTTADLAVVERRLAEFRDDTLT